MLHFRAHCFLQGALLGFLGAIQPAAAREAGDTSDQSLTLRYEASDGCPASEVFLRQLADRFPKLRIVADEQAAPILSVNVAQGEHDAWGSVDFVGDGLEWTRREVRGETCAEVIAGLALVTALALEARDDARKASGAPPAPQPRFERGSQSAGLSLNSQPMMPEPSKAEPRDVRPDTREPVEPTPAWKLRSVALGIGGSSNGWVSPNSALGFTAYTEFEFAFVSRLSGFHYVSEVSAENGRARFEASFMRLEACLRSPNAESTLSVYPCAAFDAGVLSATGVQTSDVPDVHEGRIFLPVFALVTRLRWKPTKGWYLELQTEFGVPLVRHQFVFEQPGAVVFELPQFGVAGELAAGVRF